MSSAEAIAEVVRDLRARDVQIMPARISAAGNRNITRQRDEGHGDPNVTLARMALDLVDAPVVVDATAIYYSLLAKDEPVYVYEDHPCISPPFREAVFAYQNEHGNVIAMHSSAAKYEPGRLIVPETAEPRPADAMPMERPLDWEPAEPVDTSRLAWVITTFIYVGGSSSLRGKFPTTGPVHMWQAAVYDSGEPADLHWVQLVPEYPMERWDMAQLVLLGSLNFLNCRNVSLVEVHPIRAERKRIARTGVSVHTLNVFPPGKAIRTVGGQSVGGVPLASVRGHFAHYGPQYDRGLLFGKYEGRFWISQHARGLIEFGESHADYRLRP